MQLFSKTMVLLAMLACAGCAKSSDVSDARRDHILAGPHGWIDITLHAPTAASVPAAASAPELSAACEVELGVNGESRLLDHANLAQADAAGNPIGYRFAVPAGALNLKLRLARCVRDELALPLVVALEPDHVALLAFDGQHVAVSSIESWKPVTLEAVRGDVATLHAHGESTDGALSTLTKLVLASVVLNVIVIAVMLAMAMRSRRR